jgi:hypothetical protein
MYAIEALRLKQGIDLYGTPCSRGALLGYKMSDGRHFEQQTTHLGRVLVDWTLMVEAGGSAVELDQIVERVPVAS